MYNSPYNQQQTHQGPIPFPNWFTEYVGVSSADIDSAIYQQIVETINLINNRTGVFSRVGYRQSPADFANELHAKLRFYIAAEATAGHMKIVQAADLVATDAIFSRMAREASRGGPNAVLSVGNEIGVDLNNHAARASALLGANPDPMSALTAAYNQRRQSEQQNQANSAWGNTSNFNNNPQPANALPSAFTGASNVAIDSDGVPKTGLAALMAQNNQPVNNYAASFLQQVTHAPTVAETPTVDRSIDPDTEYFEYIDENGLRRRRRRSRAKHAKLLQALSDAGVELTPENILAAEMRTWKGLPAIEGLPAEPLPQTLYGDVTMQQQAVVSAPEVVTPPVTVAVGTSTLNEVYNTIDITRIWRSDEFEEFTRVYEQNLRNLENSKEARSSDKLFRQLRSMAVVAFQDVRRYVKLNPDKNVYFDLRPSRRSEEGIERLYEEQKNARLAEVTAEARANQTQADKDAAAAATAEAYAKAQADHDARLAEQGITRPKIPAALNPKGQVTMDQFQVDDNYMEVAQPIVVPSVLEDKMREQQILAEGSLDDGFDAFFNGDDYDYDDHQAPQVPTTDPLVSALPDHLANASYDEIMDAAKAEGHDIQEPELNIETKWETIPQDVRKSLMEICPFIVPAFLRGVEELILCRVNDKITVEVRQIVKEEQHVIRNPVVCWDSKANSVDAGREKLGALYGTAPIDIDSFIEKINKKLEDTDILEEDVVLAHVVDSSPVVAIDDVLPVAGDDYQVEITNALVDRQIPRKRVNQILESAIVNYTRFATNFAPLSDDDREYVKNITNAATAREVISAINIYRSNTTQPSRDTSRLLKDFNKVLNANLAARLSESCSVETLDQEGYEELLGHSILIFNKTVDAEDIENRIDEAYIAAANGSFSLLEDDQNSDEPEAYLGKLEIVSLLPIYYTQYPIFSQSRASAIGSDTHPELVSLLSSIASEDTTSVVNVVTMDNVKLSFIASDERWFLIEVKE